MTLRRLEILQWLGLLLGGIVWFAYHLAGYSLTEASCDSVRWNIHHDLWQVVGMVVAAAFVLAAQAASIAIIRGTRDTSYDGAPPEGRLRFSAIAASAANVIFLMVILLDGLSAVLNVACRQA
jgi:hypothetical protein